ncbi:MAG: hypothetical protein ORN58_00845, partial [Sediminibacterium sp.]|nr:hypothetical protein [Sediminibacterium sp.]
GGSGGGSGQSNDSLLHTYPYNYKDTVKMIAITDKVVQIGTANQPMLNLTEFLKIDLSLNVQSNVNINARNAKFIRYNNMFVTTQNNQLLTSADGITFTQFTTSQTMSGNNSMTLISAIELTNDTLIVVNSDGTGNYIIAYLNNSLTTIAYRSQLFQLRNPSLQSITNVTKCHITNNIIYLTPELSFSNYLITLNMTNLVQTNILTSGWPVAFFRKNNMQLFYVDYQGYYYDVNFSSIRLARISTNAVTDATLLSNQYACISDYDGNVIVFDLLTNRVYDIIKELYFGSSEISTFAFSNILYVLEGNTNNLFVIGYTFTQGALTISTEAPVRFNSYIIDSAGNIGTQGQYLQSYNSKTTWAPPYYPLHSEYSFSSTASGAAQNPTPIQISNEINLTTSGTGIVIPPGRYLFILNYQMPVIDNVAPFPFSYCKWGLTSTIDAGLPTSNEMRVSIEKGSGAHGTADNIYSGSSIYVTITTQTTYYITTYASRQANSPLNGFIDIIRIK